MPLNRKNYVTRTYQEVQTADNPIGEFVPVEKVDYYRLQKDLRLNFPYKPLDDVVSTAKSFMGDVLCERRMKMYLLPVYRAVTDKKSEYYKEPYKEGVNCNLGYKNGNFPEWRGL